MRNPFDLFRPKPANPQQEDVSRLKAELAWYRWYFSEYAAGLRRRQYGIATLDIDQLLVASGSEFNRIEDSIERIVYPTQTHGAFNNNFIYFGARMIPIPQRSGMAFYALSYLGSGAFAHSGKVFDSLFFDKDIQTETELDRPYGLAESWLEEYGWDDLVFTPSGSIRHYRPLAYNTGDLDGDFNHDFIFGRWLILSSAGYQRAAVVPQESIFSSARLVSLESDLLVVRQWQDRLSITGELPIAAPALPNQPFVLMPLPSGLVGFRSERGLDIFRIGDSPEFIGWIEEIEPGEVQTGAFGDFLGRGYDQFWLSQVATTTRPNTRDHVTLIDPRRIQPGRNTLGGVAAFVVRGSRRYSDYDGISSSLSPVAGDVDGCGRPDLTFTGHRHMNESGVLYLLRNRDIIDGGLLDITDSRVIRILGREMCQLAPPYLHWDASDLNGDGRDDVVIAADNDLRAGLNAGAIYVLGGKRLVP